MRDPFSRNVLVAGKSKSKTPKHPPSLNRRVNMSKVKLDVVKPWVARRVTELLGIEDDVLVSMIFNVMEMDQIHKDGSVMYGQLLTFLERNTATFMTELWDLLVSAQENAHGVPQAFIDAKEAELTRQKEVAEALRRRQAEAAAAKTTVKREGEREGRKSRWDRDKEDRRGDGDRKERDAKDRDRDGDRDRDRERKRDRSGERREDDRKQRRRSRSRSR